MWYRCWFCPLPMMRMMTMLYVRQRITWTCTNTAKTESDKNCPLHSGFAHERLFSLCHWSVGQHINYIGDMCDYELLLPAEWPLGGDLLFCILVWQGLNRRGSRCDNTNIVIHTRTYCVIMLSLFVESHPRIKSDIFNSSTRIAL